MSDLPICPCDGFTHPAVLFNPPGRDAIAYRVGNYITFRRALLQSLANENELTQWRPGAQHDLAVQLVEWWAYLADILTFYNERIANESYLRTADLPESVQGLIQILGYRPRPGIGASGVVAALINAPKPFTLPQGFQIQSKPGPGKQPQIFELAVDTLVKPLDGIAATPIANPSLLTGASVLLKGSVTTVKVDERLLLLKKGWSGVGSYALVTVKQVQPETDPDGKTNTRVTFTSTPALGDALAQGFRLLKSNQSAHVWQHPTSPNVAIGSNSVHLDAITRQAKVGEPVLFEVPLLTGVIGVATSGQIRRDRVLAISTVVIQPSPQLVSTTEYTEVIWYANGNPADPTKQPTPPLPANVPLIPIPHSQLTFTPGLSGIWDAQKSRIIVYYDWQDVGQLIATPAKNFHSTDARIMPASAIAFFPSNQRPILLEDANDKGLAAKVTADNSPPVLQLTDLTEANLALEPPLRLLLNLLPVSRGQTVINEVLGSGNASFAGQEFTLKKAPLTYLLDSESASGKDYKSTLRIWVNDIEWQEVPSFYGQPADARVFVTREDVEQKTHVLFGDWVNGAGLPTGNNNVVATYRYGSGQEAPDAGTLNVIVKPYPNLKAIRNPVVVGGGADPDPPEQIRRYAPRSVLTFDRAVSGDDYETIAAQTPGVARARAYWTWDDDEQRSLVVIYVGDDASAIAAANTALRNAADPNRPVLVKRAIAIPIRINLSVQIDPTYAPPPVLLGVRTALLDTDRGLFGSNTVRIGQSVYQSQIFATCLQVPGVQAVHALRFFKDSGSGFALETPYRHDPGEGKFYQLSTEQDLQVKAEVLG
jgi:Baseplate J-like protein